MPDLGYGLLIKLLRRLRGEEVEAPAQPPERLYFHGADVNVPLPGHRFDRSPRIQVPEEEANLISSKTESGRHAPALDLDLPSRLVPSSTPGHYHLYVDVELSWPRYVILLLGLTLSGLMGPSYFAHSLRRRMTLVRKPGVRKPG